MKLRTRLTLIVAAVAVSTVVAAAVLLARSSRPPTGEMERALGLATQACRTVGVFRQQVAANARADRVFALLDGATASAKKAAARDPAWVPLAGGIQAVRLALDKDDAHAARLGMAVVATNCARTEAPLGGS